MPNYWKDWTCFAWSIARGGACLSCCFSGLNMYTRLGLVVRLTPNCSPMQPGWLLSRSIHIYEEIHGNNIATLYKHISERQNNPKQSTQGFTRSTNATHGIYFSAKNETDGYWMVTDSLAWIDTNALHKDYILRKAFFCWQDKKFFKICTCRLCQSMLWFAQDSRNVT